MDTKVDIVLLNTCHFLSPNLFATPYTSSALNHAVLALQDECLDLIIVPGLAFTMVSIHALRVYKTCAHKPYT